MARGFRPPKSSRATKSGARLAVTAAGARATVSLGTWAQVVFTRTGQALGKDLAAQTRSDGEWDSFYGELLAELVPDDALVAYAGEEDWRGSSVFSDLGVRFYVLEGQADAIARALADKAGGPLSALACAIEENGFHRDAWRIEEQGSRVRLSADLYYGDYGGRARVDLHVIDVATDASAPLSLLVACLYEGDFHEKDCQALTGRRTPTR